MNKKMRKGRFAAFLVALGLVFGSLAAASPAHAATGNILPPFDVGETWYICQGYNNPGVSHTGTSTYGLDLTGGPNCDNSATGRNVRIPAAGTIAYYQPTYGNLCVNKASGGSYTLTHINATVTSGSVVAGQLVGTVAGPAASSAPYNGGVAHIHFQMWSSSGCYGDPGVPFDAAHGARICGAPDLYSGGPSGGNGQWSGTSFVGDSCSAPTADADNDGVADASDLLPFVAGPINNRGVPLQPSKLAGDFNGDGNQDLVIFYDYSGVQTKLFLYVGDGAGNFAWPTVAWDSGVGNWQWGNAKPVVGDFNMDGMADIAAFYDYGGSRVKVWMFFGSSAGTFATPTLKWDSGVGNQEWSRGMPLVGDFDGDSDLDIAQFYDYGGGQTRVLFYAGDGAGNFAWPTFAWDSGLGNWQWQNMKPVVGDFNEDGKADIAASYDYGSSATKIWMFFGSSAGTFATPTLKWDSGAGNHEWWRSWPLAGDFNGDGHDDIALTYDYGSSTGKIFTIFGDGAANLSWPSETYNSGAGNWGWDHAKPAVGDFNEDGKADIGAFYRYGTSETRIWTFFGSTTGSFGTPLQKWTSGAGGMDWTHVLTP